MATIETGRGAGPTATAANPAATPTAAATAANPARPLWEPGVWDALVAAGDTRTWSAGERLLTRDDAGRSVLLVQRGACAVMDGDVVRRVVGAGEVLGEMAWLLGRPRVADVVTVTAVTAAVLEPDVLERLERLAPALMAACYRSMAAQLAGRLLVPGLVDAF